MATAKKSARKSPVKKSKTASARTTKKSVSKKATVKKSAVTAKTKARSPFDTVQDFLRGSILVYFALAAAVVAFASSAASKITLTVSAPDLLADPGGEVLSSASEFLANLQPQHLLATMLGISAAGSLLLVTQLNRKYRAGVDNKTSGFRWLYIGITAALSLEFVSLLVGVTDLMVMKMTAGLVLATALFSWLSERENATAGGPKWLAYSASLITGIFAWLAILGALIGTSVYSAVNFEWHVYAISAVVLLGFIGFAVNQYRSIKGRIADYMIVEQNYWRADFLYKLAVAAIVIAAL